jgi:hypothetical protein
MRRQVKGGPAGPPLQKQNQTKGQEGIGPFGLDDLDHGLEI